MIVPSMTSEELVKEITKDFEIVNRKTDYLSDSLRKEVIKTKKNISRIYNYKSKQNNNWLIVINQTKKAAYYNRIVYYLDEHGLNGLIMNDIDNTIVHYTPHYLKRYAERCLKTPDLSKLEILKKCVIENSYGCGMSRSHKKIFTRMLNGIGLGYREDIIGGYTLLHFKTFITDDMIINYQEEDFNKLGWTLKDFYDEYNSDLFKGKSF
jgi:hypothetical protein